MARPKNRYPVPALRLKDGVWRIRWRDGDERYEFSTGCREADEDTAEKHRLEAARALRKDADWPEWADSIAVVQRWKAQDVVSATQSAPDSATALDAWRNHYAASTSPQQLRDRLYHMEALATKHNLLSLTSGQAAAFMQSLGEVGLPRQTAHKIAAVVGDRKMSEADIIKAMDGVCTAHQVHISLRNRKVFERTPDEGKKNGGTYKVNIHLKGLAPKTRILYLQTYNMFYEWAVDQGLVAINPFRKIKPPRSEAHAEIVWLTRDERDSITSAGETTTGRLPVWIALYAGLREGEIARLRWEDIDLRGRWIHVKKSKTGKTRRVPISGALLEVLRAAERKSGFVCPHWQDGDYHVKADSDILPVTKALPALADKLRWNVFRHTFASLLAQTGKVSIDQISALMGNTPEVCRRHYAHLIPDAVERTGIDLID